MKRLFIAAGGLVTSGALLTQSWRASGPAAVCLLGLLASVVFLNMGGLRQFWRPLTVFEAGLTLAVLPRLDAASAGRYAAALVAVAIGLGLSQQTSR